MRQIGVYCSVCMPCLLHVYYASSWTRCRRGNAARPRRGTATADTGIASALTGQKGCVWADGSGCTQRARQHFRDTRIKRLHVTLRLILRIYVIWGRTSMLPHLRVRLTAMRSFPAFSRRACRWLETGAGSRLAPERVDSVNTPRNAVNALLSLLLSNPCKLSHSCHSSV